MKYQSEYETNEKLSNLFITFKALKNFTECQIKDIKINYKKYMQFYGPVVKEILDL